MLWPQRPRTELYSLVCWVHWPFHAIPHSGYFSNLWIGWGTESGLGGRELIRWRHRFDCPCSLQTLKVFTVNPLNIALLNHSVLPQNLTDYYTQLVYEQDINFNPLLWVCHQLVTCYRDVVFFLSSLSYFVICSAVFHCCAGVLLLVWHSPSWLQRKVW